MYSTADSTGALSYSWWVRNSDGTEYQIDSGDANYTVQWVVFPWHQKEKKKTLFDFSDIEELFDDI